MDHVKQPDQFPAITYKFTLEPQDCKELLALAEEFRDSDDEPDEFEEETEPTSPPKKAVPATTPAVKTTTAAVPSPTAEADEVEEEVEAKPTPFPLQIHEMPTELEVRRVGVDERPSISPTTCKSSNSATAARSRRGARLQVPSERSSETLPIVAHSRG